MTREKKKILNYHINTTLNKLFKFPKKTFNNNKIVVSSNRYDEASMRFRDIWNEYQDKEDLVKFEIVNMHNDLTILGDAITSLLDIIEKKYSKEVNTI